MIFSDKSCPYKAWKTGFFMEFEYYGYENTCTLLCNEHKKILFPMKEIPPPKQLVEKSVSLN